MSGDARRGASARRTVDDLAGGRGSKGLAVQKAIFGAGHIDALREAAPKARNTYRDYLSMNCFR